jgi:hypothetical protein
MPPSTVLLVIGALVVGLVAGWLLGARRPAPPAVRASDMPGLVVTDGSFVPICVSRDDLLVLFEWAQRFNETGKFALSHPAEAVVLDKIGGELERFLAEPFQSTYSEQLKAARERIWTEAQTTGQDWIAKVPLDQS